MANKMYFLYLWTETDGVQSGGLMATGYDLEQLKEYIRKYPENVHANIVCDGKSVYTK